MAEDNHDHVIDTGVEILLPGIPGNTDRGYLGYCTICLFRLEGEWALFDTGHYNDRHLLMAALENRGLVPDDIGHVVLSHLHFDHVLNLTLFKRAKVYLTRAELKYAEDVAAGQLTDHSIPDFWPSLLGGRTVREFDEDLELTPALHLKRLPGHTPGCLAMFVRERRTLAVCGDVIKNAWEAMTLEAAMALAGSDQASESMKTVLNRAEIIIPGHDRPLLRSETGLSPLAPFDLKVTLSVFPEPAGKTVVDLHLPAGNDLMVSESPNTADCFISREAQPKTEE